MTERPRVGYREIVFAVGVVGTGAVVALVGGHRGSPSPPGVPTAGGPGGASGPTALALVALAAAGAALLVRNRARTALGVVLVLDAVALVAVGVTPTRWSALVAAALIGIGGLLAVVRARTWPQPRGRYDAAESQRRGAPRDAWDALDRGDDPTL